MEEIRIGEPLEMEMPPEPPQLRAEDVGQEQVQEKRTKKKEGFSFKQPERKKEEPKPVVTPAEAKAEALKPRLDRPNVIQEGKIRSKAPKGTPRPI